MKKILFATTALVALAGAASAQGVELSGFAEMGVKDDGVDDGAQFHTDIDITFKMSGEADNGLAFGASINLEEAAGGIATDVEDDFNVFMSFGGATLTMGDTDGAFDKAMQEVVIGGSIADDHTIHAGYNGNAGLDGVYDGQIARLDYGIAGVNASLSVEMDDAGDYDPIWGIGVGYTADLAGMAISVGLGYQSGDKANSNDRIADTNAAVAALVIPPTASNEDILIAVLDEASHEARDIWGFSLGTKFNNGLSAILNYSEADFGDDVDFTGLEDVGTQKHWALGLGYTMNALTLGVNYGEYDDRFGVDGLSESGWGLAANYDLGGGLIAQAGYGSSETTFERGGFSASTDSDTWSLGMRMNF